MTQFKHPVKRGIEGVFVGLMLFVATLGWMDCSALGWMGSQDAACGFGALFTIVGIVGVLMLSIADV